MLILLGLCLQKGHVAHLVGTQRQSENYSIYQSMDMTALRQSNGLNLDFLSQFAHANYGPSLSEVETLQSALCVSGTLKNVQDKIYRCIAL